MSSEPNESSQDALPALQKAQRQLSSALILLTDGDYDGAAGRAYYAMFHAASQILLTNGLAFSSHGAVHAAFGRDFVKPGLFPAHLHRALLNAFDTRITADYNSAPTLSQEAAESVIRDAEEFITVALHYLRSTEPQAKS